MKGVDGKGMKGKRLRGVVQGSNKLTESLRGILDRGQGIPASSKVGRVNKARGWLGRPATLSPAPFIVQSDQGYSALTGHWSSTKRALR